MDDGSRRRNLILLVVIVVAALAIRVWFASGGLHIGRFADERYALPNVRQVLQEGSLWPAVVYYPSPVFFLPAAGLLAASQSLHEATGIAAFAIFDGDGWSPTGILLPRLLHAIYGTLTVFLLFLVARRFASWRLALLAPLILAFLPWHIRSSGYFKPDVLLTLAVILTFYLSLLAVERQRSWLYALAGVGVALAASGKLNGGLVAVPLVVGTVAMAWSRRSSRPLGRLFLTAAAGLTTFVLLNPYARHYLGWLQGLQRDYRRRALVEEMSREQIPGRLVEFLLSDLGHSLWIGPLALLGLALVTASLVRRLPDRARVRRAMLVSFPIAYTAAYLYATPYFKAVNFVVLFPFTALTATWLIDRGLAAAEARRPLPRPLLGLALGILTVGIVVPGFLFTYRTMTPTTRDMALRVLGQELEPRVGRRVYLEHRDEPRPRWHGEVPFARGLVALTEVDDLGAVSPRSLRLSDGLVAPLESLRASEAESLRDLAAQPGPGDRIFRASPFRLRGPTLLASLHPWRAREKSLQFLVGRCPAARPCFAAQLPDRLRPGDLVSIFASIPTKVLSENPGWTRTLLLNDLERRLVWVGHRERSWLFVTERFRVRETPAQLEIRLAWKRRPQPIGIAVTRWAAPPRPARGWGSGAEPQSQSQDR